MLNVKCSNFLLRLNRINNIYAHKVDLYTVYKYTFSTGI